MANYIAINKAEIRTLIPHSGLMCLLDEVVQWDDQSIACISNTHRDPANPLRRHGRLSAIHAFEYGAQAAAIHGARRGVDRRTRISGCVAGRTLTCDTTRSYSLVASDFGDASLRRRRKHGLRVYSFCRDSSRGRRPSDDRATRVRV